MSHVSESDRVWWYDHYAHGEIVSDAGQGLVIETRLLTPRHRPAGPPSPGSRYAVLKDGTREVKWYFRYEIETVEEHDERIKAQSQN